MSNSSSRSYGFNIPHKAVEECLCLPGYRTLKYMEINIPYDDSPSNIFTDARIESIKGHAAHQDVILSFHIPFNVNVSEVITSIRKKNQNYFLSSIEIAAALDIHLLTVHLGTFYWFPVEARMRRKALERFVTHIKPILEHCGKHDVKIAIENVVPLPQWSEYHHLGDSVEDFQYIFDKVDSEYLGMCLDTGHAHVGNGVVPYIEALGHKIINVHVHDNAGDDDIHLMVGKGSIPWDEVTAAFLNADYRGPFISECRQEDPAEAAKRLEEYFYNASPVKS